MYKNLQFKIVVIFVVFTIAVITSVGGIMLHRTVNFYDDEFVADARDFRRGKQPCNRTSRGF